jgi:NADH-quinone oxidoreductase subunit L
MPVTFWCMVIGLGALAGVPPLSGFWSKDGILAVAERAALHGAGPTPAWVAWLIWLAGLLGVAVTAWYATRLLLRAFLGSSRAPAAHPHDPPALMRWPIVLLAVPTGLVGLAVFAPPFRSALGLDGVHVDAFLLLPVTLLVVGAGLAWWGWRRDPAADPVTALGPLRPAFAAAFWLDEVQHALVVRPVSALARAVRRGDEVVIDGAVEGTGRGALGLAARLGALHRAGLPRAATAVLAGALLIGIAAAVVGGFA